MIDLEWDDTLDEWLTVTRALEGIDRAITTVDDMLDTLRSMKEAVNASVTEREER